MDFKRFDRVITREGRVGIVISIRSGKLLIRVEFNNREKLFYRKDGNFYINSSNRDIRRLRNNALTKVVFSEV